MDGKGKGHWFPCQSAGAGRSAAFRRCGRSCKRATTSAPFTRAASTSEYLAEHLTGKPTPGGGKPQVRFVREAVN